MERRGFGGGSGKARLLALAVLVGSGFGVSRARGFESNIEVSELYCEEAVARLQECCGELGTAPFACVYRAAVYSEPGCGESVLLDPGVDPDIDASVSRCLQRTSCEAMVARGICAAARDPKAQGASLCL